MQIFLRGLWFDAATSVFILLPTALILLFTSKDRRFILAFLLAFVLLFGSLAEHLFWGEFSSRFNFIAIDYLIYTQEVLGNIKESYPVGWLSLSIALLAAGVAWCTVRYSKKPFPIPFSRKAKNFGFYLLALGLSYGVTDISQAKFNQNIIATELAGNGFYNLFHAFWHNEINYEQFYAQHEKAVIEKRIKALIPQQIAVPENVPLQKNVIIVVMESMSAEYMGVFGNQEGWTPNLDVLAAKGLLFADNYATGTRTVRGLEAITLSIPPTPGQSIVRRPENDNLFSLGFLFREQGYETTFLYGGYSYFDNMKAFFLNNGFQVLDRNNFPKEEIQFANIWGVCDEDLFFQVIKEADRNHAEKKPFLHMVMTTSNHRPFTYPEEKIDIPPKTNRSGGVKYADYSVGQFMSWAEERPWFSETLFIFVADHTAGCAGKAELDGKKYHIPMIFYSPGFIPPGRYEKISSQIDLAPTLIGTLNLPLRTKFYGKDLLNDTGPSQAFISNYQKVALIKENKITVLGINRSIEQFHWPDCTPVTFVEQPLVEDTIAYYQSASWWKDTYRWEF